MKNYIWRRLDAGTIWMGHLPREARLALTFAAAFALYYLIYSVIDIFYLFGADSTAEYLEYEGFLLALVTAAVTALGLLSALRRKEEWALDALRCARRPELWLLWVWCAVAVVNCFIASRENGLRFLASRWALMDLFALSVLLCPLGFALARVRSTRLLHILMDAAMIITAPLYLCGIWTAFTGRTVHILGTLTYIYEGRLDLNINPNITGAYAALFMTLGLYRLHTLRSRPARILMWAGEAVWLIGLSSSASRGNLIAAAAGLGFYLALGMIRSGKKKGTNKVLPAVLVGLAAAVAFYLLCGRLKQFYYLFQDRVVPAAAGKVMQDHRGWDNAARLGGRLRIWTAIVNELSWNKHIWIHGCTPGYLMLHLKRLVGRLYYTHNQFLEILVGQGVIPMLLYCAWLVFVARDSMSHCLKGPDEGGGNWTLPIVLLVLVVANLMEALLAATTHYVGHLFFLAAGYVAGTYIPKKKEKTR